MLCRDAPCFTIEYMISSTPCPACESSTFESLIDFGDVPRSGTFLPAPESPSAAIHLGFEFCSKCGLIRRQSFGDNNADYTRVNRTTGRQMPAYCPQIITALQDRVSDPKALVIEVGANDGSFLNLIAAAGFHNLIAIEPSVECATVCRSYGHNVEVTHLDETQAHRIRMKYGGAAAVVCRHTLEHVPNPVAFISAMKTLLSHNGSLFIEIPGADGIICRTQIHELWDEHLHLFMCENVRLMLERVGFAVEEVTTRPHRDSTNILIWCTLGAVNRKTKLRDTDENVLLCRQFRGRWESMREAIVKRVSGYRRPIVALGASHPQFNFLLFSGIGKHISYLVDDDPVKENSYIPIPQPVKIISSQVLRVQPPPATILRTAFGCHAWMDTVCGAIANQDITIAAPYDPEIAYAPVREPTN